MFSSCKWLGLLGAVISVCLTGCGQRPKIDVTARVINDKFVFDIPHSDINGLLDFTISDEGGKVYWDISVPYVTAKQITYGELPVH